MGGLGAQPPEALEFLNLKGIQINSRFTMEMWLLEVNYILSLHNSHFITAHFSFITAHLCSDNSLL